jgi:excisionase family DNA binding protein
VTRSICEPRASSRPTARSSSARRSSPSQLLTIEQAADRLSVSVRNIRHQIYRRQIPIVKVGRLVRIDEEDLQDFIERGRVPAE